MESYPGRFPKPETHPSFSLLSPDSSPFPFGFSSSLRFFTFRPPSGVQPVTTGAPQPALETNDLGFWSFGRESPDRSKDCSGCSFGISPISDHSGHLRPPGFLRFRGISSPV
ncbi:hypothetical protein RchiOBHm_Chr4g0429081 [Rosa chinensis]|uniref:Uncharacterized protein n=1 Tax=Rosa chinensis TaxID=74649 RepID=A0A2P6R038_ROSCH|nr:hypothetical protein RchiOBHm_Chr4g0429081 [Rosa chinensis]